MEHMHTKKNMKAKKKQKNKGEAEKSGLGVHGVEQRATEEGGLTCSGACPGGA